MSELADLRQALEAVADPERAPAMRAYMKDRFAFLGIGAADRRAAARPFMRAARDLDGPATVALAERLWGEDERELQYVAADLLRQNAARLGPELLPRIADLITTRSWWDTVDSLASHTVGTMVAEHPSLGAVMDEWIASPNIWIARTAILHQLGYGERTDSDRLFAYAVARAADTEFFIRKALGWALRQYARTDPDAVARFVDDHRGDLSGLTIREATRHL